MGQSKIPKSRLNQIAQRKLQALGVHSWIVPDEERLEGSFEAPASLQHPLTGQPLGRIGFVVEGHDHLICQSPPCLVGLSPQQFYDFDDLAQVAERLRVKLHRRAAAAKQLLGRLQALGLQAELDQERLRILAHLALAALGTVELIGDENGLKAVRLIPLGGRGQALSMGDQAIDPHEFSDQTDLELVLSTLAQRAQAAGQPAPASGAAATPPAAPPLQTPDQPAASSASGPVTLHALVELVGPGALVSPGVVLLRDLTVAGQAVRLALRLDNPDTFTAKLARPDGVIWSGQIERAGFTGVEDFVAGKMGTAEVESAAPAPADAGTAAEPVFATDLASGQQLPIPGEVWVMNTLVESDDGNEVRYVGIDIDGQPYGAPRILPKETFERVFSQISHGVYQLPVEIATVAGGQVTYNQLNPARERMGEPRSSRLAPFLSNFIPEAASY